jgi:hypothetical protein
MVAPMRLDPSNIAFPVAILALLLPTFAGAQSDEEWEEDDDVDLDYYDSKDGATGYEVLDEDLAQTIMIVELAGETSESAGVGVLLDSYLRDALSDNSRFTVIGIEEALPVEETSADLYYRGCPPGNDLGCQFVIGEVSNVDRVVSGRVTVLTDEEGDRYRVVLTILNIATAELEYSYALDLVAGEERLLPASLALALDRLQREQLLEPVRDEEERLRRRLAALDAAKSAEERQLILRMEVSEDWDAFAKLNAELEARKNQIVTAEDLQDQKGYEGRSTEWDDLGITEKQYLSYRNSRLDFDDWRKAWAGHRLMILGSVHGGLAGGALKQHYFGRYLVNGNQVLVQDGVRSEYGWQQPAAGGTGTFGVGLGVGILRNLDIEVSVFYLRSAFEVNVGNAATDDVDGTLVPRERDTSRWPNEFTNLGNVDMWGGEVMARFFILNMKVVRPTVGAGIGWLVYPNLFPELEEGERPAIGEDYPRFDRLVDVGPQIEVGVAIEFHRNVGMFLRVPVFFGANPSRASTTADTPPPTLATVPPPDAPPFGAVRVVIGLQGRAFGLPLQPRKKNIE